MVAGQMRTMERRQSRPGQDILGTRSATVCSRCNNGWMSAIDEKAKPIITRMMRKEDFPVSFSDVANLSEWATMKFMVLDAKEGGENAQFHHDARAFMEDRRIPGRLELWVTPLEPGHFYSVFHHASGYFSERTGHLLLGLCLGLVGFLGFYSRDQKGLSHLRPTAAYDDRLIKLSPWPALAPPPHYSPSRAASGDLIEAYFTDGNERAMAHMDPPKRSQQRFRIKRPSPGANIFAPSSLPWVHGGNLFNDILCGGCDAIVAPGVTIDFLTTNLPTEPVQLIVVCPECGATNWVPTKKERPSSTRTG